MQIKKMNLAILAASGLIASPSLLAAGFQVTNHSASGLGRANAGDAVIADNASVISNNPAAMMLFDETSISVGGNMVIPTSDLTDVSLTNALGTSELDDGEDVTNNTAVPYLYIIHPINEKVAVGFSTYSDFGTNIEYDDDFNDQGNLILPGPTVVSGAGGFFAGTTIIKSLNISGSGAYRVNDNLSVGASVKALWGSGEFNRVGSADYGVDFEGEGWTYGWDLGLIYEVNEDHRFGLSYKSSMELEVEAEDDATYAALTGTVGIDSLDIDLPSIAEFSGFHGLTDNFALHYSIMYIGWGVFEDLTFNLDDDSEYVKDYNWDDSWRFGLGGTYNINEKLAVRAGIAYDESPIASENRTISIVDSNRMWYSAGATYAFNENTSVDLGVAFIDGEATDISEENSSLSLTMDGTTETTAWIGGLQLNHSF